MAEAAMTFFAKKTIGWLCMPLSVAGLLLLFGLALLWVGKRRNWAGLLLMLGMVAALAPAVSPVADRLLDPLEGQYEPVTDYQVLEGVRHVVVLGGGHRSDSRLPATMQLSDASLFRLIEGVRLRRQIPDGILVFTGGAIFDARTHARVMADAAGNLGEGEPMVLLDQPRDTAEEMLALRAMFTAEQPFLLVTSASHMPRSMILARAAGLAPIPAPTDFLVKRSRDGAFHPGEFLPSAVAMRRSERALYEFLGLVWAHIREVPRLRGHVEEMRAE